MKTSSPGWPASCSSCKCWSFRYQLGPSYTAGLLQIAEVVAGGTKPISFHNIGPGEVQISLGSEEALIFSQEAETNVSSDFQFECPFLGSQQIAQVKGYRRLPPSQYEEVKAHIRQLLEQGIISESCSPYSSPLVIVKKKDGNMRMCVDYRQFNLKTDEREKGCLPSPKNKGVA